MVRALSFRHFPHKLSSKAETVLKVILSFLIFVGLACGGSLALIPFFNIESLQAIWTVLVYVLLWVLLLFQIRELPTFHIILCGSVGLWSFLFILLSIHNSVPPPGFSYLFGIAICFASFALGRINGIFASTPDLILYAAITLNFASPLIGHMLFQVDLRILQTTVAFTSIIVMSFMRSQQMSTVKKWLCVLSLLVGAGVCYLDGARVASLIIILASLFFIIERIRVRDPFVLPFVIGQALLIFAATRWNTRTTPILTGGDQAISIGNLTFSSTGRRAMLEGQIAARLADGINLQEVFFGAGTGSSYDLSLAQGVSTPLNEFWRVFTDLGLITVSTLFFALVVLAVSFLRKQPTWATRDYYYGTCIIIGVLLFSITENMLSYSWILVPTFFLLGRTFVTDKKWALSHVESSKRGNG